MPLQPFPLPLLPSSPQPPHTNMSSSRTHHHSHGNIARIGDSRPSTLDGAPCPPDSSGNDYMHGGLRTRMATRCGEQRPDYIVIMACQRAGSHGRSCDPHAHRVAVTNAPDHIGVDQLSGHRRLVVTRHRRTRAHTKRANNEHFKCSAVARIVLATLQSVNISPASLCDKCHPATR